MSCTVEHVSILDDLFEVPRGSEGFHAPKGRRPFCPEQTETSSRMDSSRKHATRSRLDPSINYAAVSYFFGDAADCRDIEVDGKRLRVPCNAELALRYLHSLTQVPLSSGADSKELSGTEGSEASSLCLWIDSICINQSDTREREQQVALMQEVSHFRASLSQVPQRIKDEMRPLLDTAEALLQVYSKARQVWVWLGESDSYTGNALQSIGSLLDHCRSVTNALCDFEDVVYRERDGQRTIAQSDALLPETCDWSAIGGSALGRHARTDLFVRCFGRNPN